MILATKLARLVLIYKSSLELNTMVIIYNVRCLKHHGDNLQCKMQLCKFVNDAQSGKNSCIYLWKLCSTTTLLIMVLLANRPKNSKSATSKTSNENDKNSWKLLPRSRLELKWRNQTSPYIYTISCDQHGNQHFKSCSSWAKIKLAISPDNLTSPPSAFFAVSLFNQVGNLSFSWAALHL